MRVRPILGISGGKDSAALAIYLKKGVCEERMPLCGLKGRGNIVT
jgi:7-cyano-7-deazaguanine synthase in queuosine biosynthesis